MNKTTAKPRLPEEEWVGEVCKALHLSRYELLKWYDSKVVEELINIFAKSSWRSEYGTDYCLADQLDCELQAMLDEDCASVECMQLMRLIINQAKHEDCENVILSYQPRDP